MSNSANLTSEQKAAEIIRFIILDDIEVLGELINIVNDIQTLLQDSATDVYADALLEYLLSFELINLKEQDSPIHWN